MDRGWLNWIGTNLLRVLRGKEPLKGDASWL